MMTAELRELVDVLSLTQTGEGQYRGDVMDPGWGRAYGGLVVGQSLSAARQEVPKDRNVHSFHSYFLLPGSIKEPITYDVEVIRDGGSLSTRRVKAIQKGRTIFFMTASFQAYAEGLDHQTPMPDVKMPDELLPLEEALAKNAGNAVKVLPARMSLRKPFDIRFANAAALQLGTVREAVNQVWVRANSQLPDDYAIHEFLLAYVSDMYMLMAATFPHGVNHRKPDFQMATIDHSMWFHRPFRFDEWLLQVIESPSASGGRGFSLARFYDIEGRLVASAAQEGVIRQRISTLST